jgi:hypothetical protein
MYVVTDQISPLSLVMCILVTWFYIHIYIQVVVITPFSYLEGGTHWGGKEFAYITWKPKPHISVEYNSSNICVCVTIYLHKAWERMLSLSEDADVFLPYPI